ncbi:MAG: alpha/beta fold hydrolase [Burkholderiales bacterium]|nr:alpha/beta fold hydrolase [Burkholderiales bacterium]
MILYLHGFNSSPSSFKARVFAERLRRLGRGDEFVCPALPVSPMLAIRVAEDAIERHVGEPIGLVGSSMGGYYATWLAEKYGLKAALVNPAVQPYALLRDFIGVQKNFHSVAQLTLQLVEQLRQFDVAKVSKPERYLLLTQTGDKVLDYRAAVKKYYGARQVVIDGGDHSFVGFEQYITPILEFLEKN